MHGYKASNTCLYRRYAASYTGKDGRITAVQNENSRSHDNYRLLLSPSDGTRYGALLGSARALRVPFLCSERAGWDAGRGCNAAVHKRTSYSSASTCVRKNDRSVGHSLEDRAV